MDNSFRGIVAVEQLPIPAAPAQFRQAALMQPASKLEGEVLTAAQVEDFSSAWQALAARALEPNVFFEPEFAVPAMAYLAAKDLRIAVAWQGAAAARRLVGLLPFTLPLGGLSGACRAWVPNQAVLGLPLLDRDCAAEALMALLAAIGRRHPQVALLALPLVPAEGPTLALLERLFAAPGPGLVQVDRQARAALRTPFSDPLSPAAAAELRRQRRRLEEEGGLAYRRRQEPQELLEGLEQFLALEAQGWKGRRKTALAMAPATAAFVRSMAQRMAATRKIAIDSLELAGRPIAMEIMIESGSHAYFWKIAYDEAQARRSPGVLFTQDFTRRQLAEPGIVLTNSCAQPDHPMINRLWRDRRAVVDVAVPLRPARRRFGAALLAERLGRKLRAALKAAYGWLRGNQHH